jgi:hypothetical protein
VCDLRLLRVIQTAKELTPVLDGFALGNMQATLLATHNGLLVFYLSRTWRVAALIV